jgi:hypothetical protein
VSEELHRYFLILGLEPGASREELRLAYRDCVEAWHPDRFAHCPERQQRAQARLKQINEAYHRLRSHDRRSRPTPPREPASAHPGPRPNGREAPPGERSGPRADASATGQDRGERRQAEYRPPSGDRAPETPATRPVWIELSRESRFTVTALYYTLIGMIVAAGCGISLGAIFGGPVGAACGLIISPLAGISVAWTSAAVAAAVAGRIGGPSANIVGGAVALLLPGCAFGAVLVWSTSRALLGGMIPPFVDLSLGSVLGGGAGLVLGIWTGKAVSVVMGEA